jgi:hypothetical protein
VTGTAQVVATPADAPVTPAMAGAPVPPVPPVTTPDRPPNGPVAPSPYASETYDDPYPTQRRGGEPR